MRLLWNFCGRWRAWAMRRSRPTIRSGNGRMVVVAGGCASGKSTLCGEIVRNRHQDILGVDMSGAELVHAKQFRKNPVHEVFPGGRNGPILVHYDIGWLVSRGLENYAEDPATAVMRMAGELDIILVVPSPERLRRQLLESEAVAGNFQKSHHALYAEQYQSSAWLSRLYGNWIDFCAVHVPHGRYLLYAGCGDTCEMVRCDSSRAAMAAVQSVYRDDATARPAAGNGLPVVFVAWLAQMAEALV